MKTTVKWARRAVVVLMLLATAGLLAGPAAASPKTSAAAATAGDGPRGRAEVVTPRKLTGQSAAAVVTPQIWYTHWYSGTPCTGSVCQVTSVDSIPRFYVSGQNFTLGGVVDVAVFRMDGTAIEWAAPTARSWPGYSGGSWGWKAKRFDCGASNPTHAADSFLQAYDRASGRWSNRIYVYSGCFVL